VPERSLGLRTESAFNIEHGCVNEQGEHAHQEREGMNEPEETLENRIIDVSVIDPVCGMAVNPVEARGKAQYEGQTYHFCSPACMHKFVSSPAKCLSAVREAPSNAPAPAGVARKLDKDPVCGMDVDGAKAVASVEYEGRLYHFCSRGCAEKFKDYPEKYLSPNYKAGGTREFFLMLFGQENPGRPQTREREKGQRLYFLCVSVSLW
jgi:YHS domain-containing protein